jgi:hypothetical protein
MMNRPIKITANLLAILLTVLLCIPVFAQKSGTETIYMHTDRTVYTAGETIHYKLYLLDGATQKPSNLSKIGYILIRNTFQAPTIKCRVNIVSGFSSGSISIPDTISSGVYQLVAYTNLMKNNNEKPFFRNEIVIINSFDNDFNFKLPVENTKTGVDSIHYPFRITTNKTIYNKREKVVVHIDKANIKANLSVSVSEDSNIKTSNNSIFETLVKFRNQPVNKAISTNYLPERSGKIIRGRVLDTVTGENIDKAIVLLSCVDTVPNLQYAITNSNGVFQMQLSDYHEGKELFFTVRNMPINQHWKIETENEFAQSELWKPELKCDLTNYKSFLTKSQNMAYINSSYESGNDTTESRESAKKAICPQFYYCPVRTVLPADYTSMNDFKEIVTELFPEISISKEKRIYKVSVLNGSQKMFSGEGIAIFMDGVYVDDVEKIMKLGSEQIKKIDVLNTERVFGNLVYKGVISIITKSTEIEKTTPSSYSLRMKNDKTNSYDNYIVERPDTISNKTFPFFRQLLYWNPDIEIKEQESTCFDFITSDNEGIFILKIEGITDDGQPISFSKNIQVINQTKSTEK